MDAGASEPCGTTGRRCVARECATGECQTADSASTSAPRVADEHAVGKIRTVALDTASTTGACGVVQKGAVGEFREIAEWSLADAEEAAARRG